MAQILLKQLTRDFEALILHTYEGTHIRSTARLVRRAPRTIHWYLTGGRDLPSDVVLAALAGCRAHAARTLELADHLERTYTEHPPRPDRRSCLPKTPDGRWGRPREYRAPLADVAYGWVAADD